MTGIPFSHETQRATNTINCRDAEAIPKVANAGRVEPLADGFVQVMHNGLRVEYGGYYGDWMANIIHGLRGHHEPQEERVFHELLRYARPRTSILELGAFWAYYSMWFLSSVPFASAYCIEPDPKHLEVGRRNMRLNGLDATFINAMAAGTEAAASAFTTECGAVHQIPSHSAPSALRACGLDRVEILHVDIQGAELALLEGARPAFDAGAIRFIVVSTHHASISGSPTTHRDCLALLRSLGANILCEHDIDESFSGDGLIAAAMRPEDRHIPSIEVTRARRGESLFPEGY